MSWLGLAALVILSFLWPANQVPHVLLGVGLCAIVARLHEGRMVLLEIAPPFVPSGRATRSRSAGCDNRAEAVRGMQVLGGDHGRGKCQRQAVELAHARSTVTDPLGESFHAAGGPLPVVLANAPGGPGQRANRPHHPGQPRRPEYGVESATPARRLPR